MPRYTYFCHSCRKTWNARRSMGFVPDRCKYCEGKTIDKVPSSFIKVVKGATGEDKKVGDITKEHIEAAREDLKDMRGDLKITEYVPDD